MCCEIVARNLGLAPVEDAVEHSFEFRPIDGSGVIEIDPGSLNWRQMGAIAIKVIQRQATGVVTKG
jgi:hypothetical protein